jgi:DNA-directed RNA polymerase beta' subunit
MSEIKSIRYGIFGDEDVLAASIGSIYKSALTIEHGAIYDSRLGCVNNNTECETCHKDIWTCTGHFGHVDLAIPIIFYHRQVVKLLKCFCFSCYRLLVSKDELYLNNIYGHRKILDWLSKRSSCSFCKTPVPEIRFNIADAIITASHKCKTDTSDSSISDLDQVISKKRKKITKEITPADVKCIFDQISDDDVKLIGLDVELTHPKKLVLTKLPVLPTCCRPNMTSGDNVSDDDLSLLLVDIKKHPYDELKTQEEIAAYDKALLNIKIKSLAYCDNNRGRVKHNTNHKPMIGTKERIGGKNGLMRQNLTGKRCDRTARTVIGPDPTLKIDELVVPEDIANTITIPEIVTPYNITRLSRLVNIGKAASIIRQDGKKFSVAFARTRRGTKLEHGDVILRNGKSIPVLNCKMELKQGDKVKKSDGIIDVVLPSIIEIKLAIGDKVERYLQDGDPVFLNRQPTLHRNGMLGMKVKVMPCKTLRFNLSITKGLNADFDGDEGNMFTCETLESAAELTYLVNVKDLMLSAQINKPEQVLVQDGLLAVYLMTFKPIIMTRADFMQCLFRTNSVYKFKESTVYKSSDLFTYILPEGFCYSGPNVKIENGVITSGYFDKTSFGSNKNSIIRVLCMAADFIDNVQFLTNGWLELYPFSIGIADCLMSNDEKKMEIKSITQKYFVEASAVSKSTTNQVVREMRINQALNKAKDIGLRIAKETLKENNNCVATVNSGSKGDFFNIAQITGLLGQQNISNQRPKPTLNNGKRTLIHYPHLIMSSEQEYESRGFVSSCFLGGLNPKEMWFHAMTGREGMINTANKTARSGYIQRSCIKLNEDLQAEYDGTIRDASGGIHQFIYGNHGFDPARVNFGDETPIPIDINRLAKRLKGATIARKLNKEEIEEIIKECKWSNTIPIEIYESVSSKRESFLRNKLLNVSVYCDRFSEFKSHIATAYHTSRITPGECVGIISAQSIGEVQTQSNLNTFHTAGKLQSSGVERFEEIINVPKVAKSPSMIIYFKDKYNSPEELRCAISSSFVCKFMSDLMISPNPKIGCNGKRLTFLLKRSRIHEVRLTPDFICETIKEKLQLDCKPDTLENYIPAIIIDSNNVFTKSEIQNIKDLKLCGIDKIVSMTIEKDDVEFYVSTEGSNLRKILSHNLVDLKRVYSNDIIETFECLGIAATRQMLFNDIKKVVCGVNDCHIQLLVDKMTFIGRPSSITRYTMKTNAVGPLSKATFEQIVDILLSAAFEGERDSINGVSAAIVTGNRVKIGTGKPEMIIDYKTYLQET